MSKLEGAAAMNSSVIVAVEEEMSLRGNGIRSLMDFDVTAMSEREVNEAKVIKDSMLWGRKPNNSRRDECNIRFLKRVAGSILSVPDAWAEACKMAYMMEISNIDMNVLTVREGKPRQLPEGTLRAFQLLSTRAPSKMANVAKQIEGYALWKCGRYAPFEFVKLLVEGMGPTRERELLSRILKIEWIGGNWPLEYGRTV